MTEEDEEDSRKNINCWFFETNIVSDKIRDHCHLTGKYRETAHNTCNKNVTRNKAILYLL